VVSGGAVFRKHGDQVEICSSTADRWFIPKRPMSSDGTGSSRIDALSAQKGRIQRVPPGAALLQLPASPAGATAN